MKLNFPTKFEMNDEIWREVYIRLNVEMTYCNFVLADAQYSKCINTVIKTLGLCGHNSWLEVLSDMKFSFLKYLGGKKISFLSPGREVEEMSDVRSDTKFICGT